MFEKTLISRSAMLVVAGTVILAACTTAATPSPTASPAAAATPTAAETAAGSPTQAAGGETYTVNVATGTAGDYLTGEDGKSLYVKGDDSTTSTTCTGACLDAWPPFTLEAGDQVVAGAGVDQASLSSFTRPEGTTQVTYKDKPLYYFAQDTAAGDTNGVGIADWTLATP